MVQRKYFLKMKAIPWRLSSTEKSVTIRIYVVLLKSVVLENGGGSGGNFISAPRLVRHNFPNIEIRHQSLLDQTLGLIPEIDPDAPGEKIERPKTN